jgi:hypothetical protein
MEGMIRTLFRDWTLDASKLPSVLAEPLRYPYLYTEAETIWCRLYLTMVEEMRIEPSDTIDTHLMLYMQGADILVSDDRRLRRLFDLVWGSARQMLTLAEFMSHLRVHHEESLVGS